MPPKRKRRASPPAKGLAPGELLKRTAHPRCGTSPWSWVGSEVQELQKITHEHRLSVYGLSSKAAMPCCKNKYAASDSKESERKDADSTMGELDDDIIVISDDEDFLCSKKYCKNNPGCLNYLGQEMWEDESDAFETFLKAANLGDNPILDSREPDVPVGLKNLGATCYANASLQVWYRDTAFRDGVYRCQPPEGAEDKYKDSPIFQLQVTFAALQESNQNVFNPTKLVESLQLRTSEQQDAQEFSKLFMSHLDVEFKKQSSSSIKSLITDQFQGSQVYGTICGTCQYKSERTSDFLEIEVNFEGKSLLEERIAASLQPETLSRDNQYFCSQCNSLQDATRYTELRQLPPVLHFSLLRFVYDLSTMERKKSKHAISFPTILNMSQFIGGEDQRKELSHNPREQDMYELKGVLLHKGISAYYGHYEAQVYDPYLESWFQFNDETVTEIKSLGDQSGANKTVKIDEVATEIKHSRANARKRRRIDDSDDGNQSDTPISSCSEALHPKGSIISSKDAYMLIYAKKGDVPDQARNNDMKSSSPLDRALDVVHALNEAHDKACEEYDRKEQLVKVKFQETRRKVMDIYQTWKLDSLSSDFVVVGKQRLEEWLTKHCIESAINFDDPDDPSPSQSSIRSISNSDILCIHEKLDPTKSQEMKTIPQHAYRAIVTETHCDFNPILDASDVCVECISVLFQERLYEVEHPRLVKVFEQIQDVDDGESGFWISKRWLKDWKLLKPRMHIPSEGDPSPDSAEFESHIKCEHGCLSPNTTNRRKISIQATKLFKDLYPSWEPLASDEETCAVCDALVHISKEDKREIRRRAEEEKAKLKYMNSIAFSFGSAESHCTSYALIPTQFYRSWRRWLDNPVDYPRPDSVDNSLFICSHQMLLYDPNCPADVESLATIIRREDWDTLQTIYSAGPLIALQQRIDPTDGELQFDHADPICSGCRLKRQSEWESAEVIVHLQGQKFGRKQITTYSRNPGARQSKRLRDLNGLGERRKLTITKSTTVKDMKIMIFETFNIPTICQRLCCKGKELGDNEATVDGLGILANDVLDLHEANQIVDLDSDSDTKPIRKKPREEGQGFSGTVLGGPLTDSSRSSSRADTPFECLSTEKPCRACTFSNPIEALSCTICDTFFE